MFRQIILGFSAMRAYIQKLAQKHSQRISALMMASKMLSVVILLGFMPLDGIKVPQRKPLETNIKLDTKNSFVLTGKDRQVNIVSGESQIDLEAKAQAPKLASAGNVSYSVERDPSYFRGLYQRAGAAYGVPWQLLEAVHYTETGASDSTSEASYAGATGPMQFMPGTWRTWGVDGNGDGSAEIANVEDAVYGAANLLAAGGASSGDYQSALFNYNHAQWYVDRVLNIARDAGM